MKTTRYYGTTICAKGAGGGAGGDDSSDWEEVSEEGEADDGEEALSVPGLLGQDLLDITAVQAAADDDLGNLLRVRTVPRPSPHAGAV